MKQRITDKQWDELTLKQKGEMRGWFSTTYDFPAGMYPPLYIGQLIEFLGDDCYHIWHFEIDKEERKLLNQVFPVGIDNFETIVIAGEMTSQTELVVNWRVLTYTHGWDSNELCDALWEAVKYKLNRTK